MREMVLGQDSNFTIESFIKRYNSDLANDFGNLLSRVSTLITRNFAGKIPEAGDSTEAEKAISALAKKTVNRVQSLIDKMRVNEAIEETMQFIRGVNRYMEQQAPWKQVKEDKAAAGRTLYTAAEALRIGALLLHPVMPNRTDAVLRILNSEEPSFDWGKLKSGTVLIKHDPLFPRIDTGKKGKSQPPPKKKEPKTQENVVTFDEFQKLKLKTAKILKAESVEGADRLLKLQIDVGGCERQIVAGIAEYYSPESLIGKTIVIVANLKPAKIRGVESNGMLLAAKKGKELSLITVDSVEMESGDRKSVV